MDSDQHDRLMHEYAPRLAAALGTQGVGPLTVVAPVDDDVDSMVEPDTDDDTLDPEDEPEVDQLPGADGDDEKVVKDPDGDGDDDSAPAGDTDGDDDEPAAKPSKPLQRAYARAREVLTRDRVDEHAAVTPVGNDIWKPVITTAHGRTFLTAPATTERAAMWNGVPPNPNPHLMWMEGRFVGGDRPNRNGAYWSAQDLEVGKPTVTHGPLNWLHEDTHVIGTIADARFVPMPGGGGVTVENTVNGRPAQQQSMHQSERAREQAAETADPHIVALSAIWRWIYPQEASVVQMASDAGVLAYSMECISEAVQCVGDNGCGQSTPYMAYARGQMCEHLKERATVRRLVNPTFLGGAVIVPPSRPGWADADARVMAEAAKVAEKAYDQAGRPDIPASTWEALMAGVVKFSEGTR